MGRKCCDDDFGLLGDGTCTDCPYLTQCTDNKKESIKEVLEEETENNIQSNGKRKIDNGDDL